MYGEIGNDQVACSKRYGRGKIELVAVRVEMRSAEMKEADGRIEDVTDEGEDLGGPPAIEHAATMPALTFAVSPETTEPAQSEVGLANGGSGHAGIAGCEGESEQEEEPDEQEEEDANGGAHEEEDETERGIEGRNLEDLDGHTNPDEELEEDR